MAVPNFQTWFLPLLKRVADGQVHQMAELYDQLADDLELSNEDRTDILPSGKTLKYRNRIAWARTYLKKAGLLETPLEGQARITERGRKVLASPPATLNVKYLMQYPEFVEFQTARPKTAHQMVESPADVEEILETPEETLGRIHGKIRVQLEQDLLLRVKAAPPSFFEQVVIDLLLKMGYGGPQDDAGQTVGRSGDGGIDGIINEDRLGLDVIYVQAKRWEGTVGRPVVQAFIGSLEGMRANKGVMITTSAFSPEAKGYVSMIQKKVVLIDGSQLASLMVEHNLGVAVKSSLEIKRIDTDYFEQ